MIALWAVREGGPLSDFRPSLLIATDLDGCLLDAESDAFAPARPALDALASSGALLVLASGKTRPEVLRVARALGIRAPLIVENGGGLLIPKRTFSARVPGSRRSGGFSSLPPRELEAITGLTRPQIRLARRREWDEPFLVDAGHANLVAEAACQRGLRVTRGGRFHRLGGAADRGSALGLVLDLFATDGKRFETVGLGASGNDLPMLLRVRRPILIPRPDGTIDPSLAAGLPLAERAPAPGPVGWNAAVLRVLQRA